MKQLILALSIFVLFSCNGSSSSKDKNENKDEGNTLIVDGITIDTSVDQCLQSMSPTVGGSGPVRPVTWDWSEVDDADLYAVILYASDETFSEFTNDLIEESLNQAGISHSITTEGGKHYWLAVYALDADGETLCSVGGTSGTGPFN